MGRFFGRRAETKLPQARSFDDMSREELLAALAEKSDPPPVPDVLEKHDLNAAVRNIQVLKAAEDELCRKNYEEYMRRTGTIATPIFTYDPRSGLRVAWAIEQGQKPTDQQQGQ